MAGKESDYIVLDAEVSEALVKDFFAGRDIRHMMTGEILIDMMCWEGVIAEENVEGWCLKFMQMYHMLNDEKSLDSLGCIYD